MLQAKPFVIPKREVWEAFKKVRANQGAAGVDGQSVEDFEADLTMPIRLTHTPTIGRAVGMGDLAEIRRFHQISLTTYSGCMS